MQSIQLGETTILSGHMSLKTQGNLFFFLSSKTCLINSRNLFFLFYLFLQPLSDANFKKGFNHIYDINLARARRRIYSKHHSVFEEEASRVGGKRM